MDREIKIEKLTVNDFDNYFRLVNDERVMAMITERAISVQEAKEEYKERLASSRIHKDFGSFKIIDGRNNSFIGFAKLELEDIADTKVELGYMILPAYWGQGIASKVSELLIKVAKGKSSINQVYAIIDPANIASRKVLLKNGFKHQAYKDYDGLPGEILELNLKNNSHE